MKKAAPLERPRKIARRFYPLIWLGFQGASTFSWGIERIGGFAGFGSSSAKKIRILGSGSSGKQSSRLRGFFAITSSLNRESQSHVRRKNPLVLVHLFELTFKLFNVNEVHQQFRGFQINELNRFHPFLLPVENIFTRPLEVSA